MTLEEDIIQNIEDKLMQENNSRGGYKNVKTQNVLMQEKATYDIEKVDIFGSLALEKKAKIERMKTKNQTSTPSNSKAGKL